MKILKDAAGNTIDLEALNEKQFLVDSRNYADLICDQINDGIYDFVKDLVNENSVVIDLGANIGYFSYYISPLVKEIHAFEPTPETHKVLKKLKEYAELDKLILHKKAISSKDGFTTFYVYEHNRTMNSLRELKNVGRVELEVETVSLANFVNNFDTVDFIKIDIEGGEKELLFDPSFEDVSKKVKNIFVEIHEFDTFMTPQWQTNMEFNISRATEVLEKFGYNVQRISEDGLVAKK